MKKMISKIKRNSESGIAGMGVIAVIMIVIGLGWAVWTFGLSKLIG